MLAVEVYAYCVVFVGSTVDDAALIYLRKPFIDLAIIATGTARRIPGRSAPASRAASEALRGHRNQQCGSSAGAVTSASAPVASRANRIPTAHRRNATIHARRERAHDRRS
jgi:hypothetical protein